MPKHRLTDAQIRGDALLKQYELITPDGLPATNHDKRVDIHDDGKDGLILRLSAYGKKSFYFRYRINGKYKRFKLGDYSKSFRLAEARSKVDEIRVQLNQGIDPQKEKRKQFDKQPNRTFHQLVHEYIEIELPQHRPKTQEEHKRIIKNELIPAFGNLELDEITPDRIISLLDKKAIKQSRPTMANRIRGRLHTIFEFAVDRRVLKSNPVTGIKQRKEGETKRSRFYSEDELRKLWDAFNKVDEPARSVVKMLLLTGQRSTETKHMRWQDIRVDVWIIPASLSKSNREHEVPLSSQAMKVIEQIRPLTSRSEYVFASNIKEDAPVQWMKRATKKIREQSGVSDFRLHDLRRTAATYMAGLSVDRTVLGKILNHKGLSGDGQVTAIYDRYEYFDEKREALQRWADHLDQVLTDDKEARVYKLG